MEPGQEPMPTIGKLRHLVNRLVGREKPPESRVARVNAVFDEYVDTLPCAQNAVDLIPGWNHALPPEAGAVAGEIGLYSDARIDWCIEQYGDLRDRKVLELGPLEAAHTYMLHKHCPAVIDAVEANKLAFLRCLIVKELLHLDRARFWMGDFTKWLEHSGRRYDLIVASGVLYHMRDPVRLLELASDHSDSLYLWTHYYSDTAMPEGDFRRDAFDGNISVREFGGISVRLHHRSYREAWRSKAFCGGMRDDHVWMEKEQIIEVLAALGFADIRTNHDTNEHPHGPCISIFARRL